MKDKDFKELLESVKQMVEIMDGKRQPSRVFRYTKENRIKKTSPKPGKYWCFKCDGALVGKGQRCHRCGQKDMSKRQKI